LNLILTDAEKGQSVFFVVERSFTMPKHSGHAGGQFCKEWTAMTKRCKEVESKSIAHLKEEHYDAKMRDEQQPRLFIAQMERLKINMKEKHHNVSDKDFIHDILSKLPESKSSLMMSPHQTKKLFIKEKLTSACTLDMLTIDLSREDAHRECQGSERKERIK